MFYQMIKNARNRWLASSDCTVKDLIVYIENSGQMRDAQTDAIKTYKLSVATAEITNTVYYYPLVDGVGNFLKYPMVKIADIADSSRIIENGVREFLNAYKDIVYQDGTAAKLGIYCGTIEKLEELVYPLVARIAGEYGLSADCILKFHKGNKQYPQPADSQMQFDTLDHSISKIRIVLLVQIGKEGWDCRSLTGIILSQEGDCPKNMVLQTSCRCLRQVDRGQPESALIYLNSVNGNKLIAQLRQRHHISLNEFTKGSPDKIELNRYDRTSYLKLPKVDFYQLKVYYETVTLEDADPERDIPKAVSKTAAEVIRHTDFSLENIVHEVDNTERGTELAVFSQWLYGLSRSSFGFHSMEQLNEYRDVLRSVFETITYERDGVRYFSSRYDRPLVEANIRKAFCEKRSYNSRTEHIPEYEIMEDDDGIFIFPKGVKQFDDVLVSQPLEWLKDFPNAETAWSKALRNYAEATEDNASDVADKFRKAMEIFFQEFFGGSRSLENYKADYGKYLKERGVPKEISGNFETILQTYTNYMNSYAKHRDRTSDTLLEYIMYQTGNIIRLLIVLRQEETANAD